MKERTVYRCSNNLQRRFANDRCLEIVVPRRKSPTHTISQARCSCPGHLPPSCLITSPPPTLGPSVASSSHWEHLNAASFSVLPGSPGTVCRPELQQGWHRWYHPGQGWVSQQCMRPLRKKLSFFYLSLCPRGSAWSLEQKRN